MTIWTLILRNFRFHARAHFGTLLGVAISSAVLIGALAVGDSIRESLRQMALSRLGKVQLALASGDRFVRAKLADDISAEMTEPAAPVVQIAGIAVNQDNSGRANNVQILGVDERFWNFSRVKPAFTEVEPESVVLNQRLAEHLNVKVGETILLRMHKPSLLSREMPISPQEDFSLTARLKVQAIIGDQEFGRFSLQANQIPPLNAFVALGPLQEKLGIVGKANLLLAGVPKKEGRKPEAILREAFQLADAELQLRDVENARELRSDRIMMEPSVVRLADAVSTNNTKLLTYFVNEFRVGERSTPYSMVTAATAPLVPSALRDDEILINQWLADDLRARAGDQIQLSYFVPGADQRLDERTNTFRIRSIVLMRGQYVDRTLMPDFPGIAKAEKTENWDAGFPIDMGKIRPKDEQYWKDHRGTPKAFVTLAAGKAMWGNRFGEVTGIRWPPSVSTQEVQRTFSAAFDPASVGFYFQPVRELALAASSPTQDYGQLFLGFSFFLIAAALILVGLLFQLSLEQRASEMGALLSLGLRPQVVRRMLLGEGMLIAVAGTALGVFGGIFYAKAMLHALTTIWRSAVGTTALMFTVSPATLVTGAVSSIVVSALTIWLVTRKQAQRSARELLTEGTAANTSKLTSRRWAEGIAIGSGVVAIALVGWAATNRETNVSGAFFGGGSLLLIAGIAGGAYLLKRLARSQAGAAISLAGTAIRNATRRRKRSLATMSLLAGGAFLTFAVGAFRLETDRSAMQRSSGTGGFAFIGETALPVVQNLNEKSGREFFGIDNAQLTNVSFVPFRVRDGDDASCLNLNSAQKPRLLGVQPEQLQQRKAFTFSRVSDGFSKADAWQLLKSQRYGDDEIPAIGDAASIQWALRKKIGDTIDYTDEQGKTFKIRIAGAVANSILQGSLIIDEAAFVKRFPGETGYRMFLVVAPSKNVTEVSQILTRALRDVGLEMTPTTERLAAFNAVQNTYLSTFQLLGALGLLLGSAGVGVVVLRNVLERRGELALMSAVGFRKRGLRWLVLGEHSALLLLGLLIGIGSALVAILPALLAPGTKRAGWSLMLTLALIFGSGLIWTWLATTYALRGKLLEALRNE